jgi:hypothetical protein
VIDVGVSDCQKPPFSVHRNPVLGQQPETIKNKRNMKCGRKSTVKNSSPEDEKERKFLKLIETVKSHKELMVGAIVLFTPKTFIVSSFTISLGTFRFLIGLLPNNKK